MAQEFRNDREGRRDLYAAMKGKKVYVDDLPHTHAAAIQLLWDGAAMIREWDDVQTLKLAILWDEWEGRG